MKPAPEPGIYPNVPFDEYCSWDAVNNSRLNKAQRSLYQYNANCGMKETRPLVFGHLTHAATLEPLQVANIYAVMPDYENDPNNLTQSGERPGSPRSTSWYKRKCKEFTEANKGKKVVTQQEYDEVLALVQVLHRDQVSRELLTEEGDNEVSIVWVDSETELICKARFDRLLHKSHRFVDLKTTRNALKFAGSIVDFGYHRQMAHYQSGLIHLKQGEVYEPWILAVESHAPNDCRSAPLSDEFLSIGYEERDKLMRAVKEASESGEWPGYENPSVWNVPGWYGGTGTIELTIGGKKVEI
jgi:hypothetical protein